MEHLFILNPVAGKGKTLRLVPEIEGYFRVKAGKYIIETTKYPGHATEIAADYSARGDYRIYSVGGDGTLNEVLNGMAFSGSSLAVIPSGSGNDFIRSVFLNPHYTDIIAETVEGREKMIDFARVNGKCFINIISLGFDAQVAHKTEHFKKIPLISGKIAYILGILTSIMECSNHYIELKVDDVPIKTGTLLIAVGNGRYYGGGMLALPTAEVDDGLLDICHVESKKRTSILRLFPKYMKGVHGSIKGVHFYKGKRVEIRPDCPIPMNMDGEILIVEKADLEIIPKGLKFIVPYQEN